MEAENLEYSNFTTDTEKVQRSVVLISFLFDPCSDVGALRWSRLARSLSNKAVDLKVLTSDYRNWNGSGGHSFFDVETFPAKYPEILDSRPSQKHQHLHYRLNLFLRTCMCKGSPYDKAALLRKNILSRLKRYYEAGFRNYIVTGAPFNLCYYGSLFKQSHPDIMLLIDFRDPWTWNSGYGFALLNKHQQAMEMMKEKFCVEVADVITVPVEQMKTHLKHSYPHSAEKIHVLPHGFDKQKLTASLGRSNISASGRVGERTKLVYGGTVYPGSMGWLLEVDKLLGKTEDVLYYIYALNNDRLTTLQLENVHIRGRVPEQELYREIARSDAYLAIYPSEYKDFVSTKIIEIVAIGKPIILIAPHGNLSEFIVQNGLGTHILPENLPQLLQLLSNGKHNLSTHDRNFPIEQYSTDHISEQLLKMMGLAS